jgi:hypothetical protein
MPHLDVFFYSFVYPSYMYKLEISFSLFYQLDVINVEY